jgi:hypothetical protein
MAVGVAQQHERAELEGFIRDYSHGKFPLDRPPKIPKLLIKTGSRPGLLRTASTVTIPQVNNPKEFASYVENFWDANRYLPQLPTSNDAKRSVVIKRSEFFAFFNS